MITRLFRPLLCFLIVLSLGGLPSVTPTAIAQAEPAAFVTTITVDTSADLDPTSITKTCTYTQGAVFFPGGDGCTFRRALLEASARPDGDRPILIQFNLPNGDANHNLEVNGTWTLPIAGALPHLDRKNSLSTDGQVTIDGSTQPNGRTDGPKIIIATDDNSLEIESEDNVISGLAFKGGGVIFLKEDNNTVEDIWMGLSDDGQSIVFRTGQPMRMAGGGVFITSDGNTVQNNVISGAYAKAVDIDGGNNLVKGNLIGTRADGTVPAVAEASQCARSLSLDPQNWYGGWGISLSGTGNTITQNRIAGLHIVQTANATPPIAIEIFGADHMVTDNIIGVDSADEPVGVCGQGIKVAGSGTQIMDNTVVGSRIGFEDIVPTAILANDSSPLFDRITVRRNLVENGPGGVYEFGPMIPEALKTFNPAKITGINGLNVVGTNGDSSPCPGCLIDFYRDDSDEIGEALEYLGNTTAAGDGSFSFQLPQALPAGSGIRTSSTTQAANVIANYGAGMTTKVSKLYMALDGLTLVGPTTGEVGTKYAFTATVTPSSGMTLDYTAEATDFSVQALSSDKGSVVASYTWTDPGVKTVKVTAENDLGMVSDTVQITIAAPPSAGGLFLPLAQK